MGKPSKHASQPKKQHIMKEKKTKTQRPSTHTVSNKKKRISRFCLHLRILKRENQRWKGKHKKRARFWFVLLCNSLKKKKRKISDKFSLANNNAHQRTHSPERESERKDEIFFFFFLFKISFKVHKISC